MSLYNILFGKNPDTETILTALNLTESDVERFRDCWIDENNEEILIYTRTGGGNRERFPNEALTSHPLYRYDEDDAFDSTYATYHFSLPEPPEEDE